MFDIIMLVSNYAGVAITIATFLAVVITPIRKGIVNWINTKVGTMQQNQAIEELQSSVNTCNESVEAKLDRILEENEKQNAMIELHKEIHLCTLRNRITHLFYQYNDAPIMPSYEKKNLIEHYKLYKRLGGNSYIDELFEVLKKKDMV